MDQQQKIDLAKHCMVVFKEDWEAEYVKALKTVDEYRLLDEVFANRIRHHEAQYHDES